MLTLPAAFQTLILPYATLFCKRVFAHAQLLLAGAILTPGKRTVTAALRIMGLAQEKAFHKYHRVLSHAHWSAKAASRVLLGQLLEAFVGRGPVVVGIDETLERRWGAKSLPGASIETPSVVAQATSSSAVACGGSA